MRERELLASRVSGFELAASQSSERRAALFLRTSGAREERPRDIHTILPGVPIGSHAVTPRMEEPGAPPNHARRTRRTSWDLLFGQACLYLILLILLALTRTHYLFDSTSTFQIAALALVATTFLFSADGARMLLGPSTLVIASVATVSLFLAGATVAFYEFLTSTNITTPGPILAVPVGAVFLLGIIDLLIVGVQLVRVAYDSSNSRAPP